APSKDNDHVNVPLLDLVAQYRAIRDEVLPALQAVIESQQFVMGPPVVQLEAAVASLCRAPHAIACASGTDALLLALKALRLEPGDEVITTPFTFFATACVVDRTGHLQHRPCSRRCGADPAHPGDRAGAPVRANGRAGAAVAAGAGARCEDHRGRRSGDRGTPQDRRPVAHGRRAGLGDRLFFLSE